MMAIRLFRQKLGQFRGKILTSKDLRRWEKTSCRTISKEEFVIHLLVVKNPRYGQMARISALSFLYFHPASKVIIHVDEQTKDSVKKWMTQSKYRNSMSVEFIEESLNDTWQLLKTKLLLKLAGTFEFFIDADMRWNSVLKLRENQSSGVLFFVEEYRILENDTFSKMLEDPFFKKYRDSSMWNTSFVCFSGYEVNEAMQDEIFELQEKILQYASTQIANREVSTATIRISEQLAISLAVSQWNTLVSAVKDSDGYKDGAFLESSYFGATGTHF